MPKRSAEDKLVHYQRKIKKLEDKVKKKRRIRRPFDSSDDENLEGISNAEPQLYEPRIETSENEPNEQQSPSSPQAPPMSPQAPNVSDEVQESILASTETTSEPSLDPELLSALGASTSDTPDFGDPIHDSLASLWLPLVRKGLSKEDKSNLMKEYLIPSNCKLLQAPKLNAEISAAVSEVVRNRDKKLDSFQQSLGAGTSAINRAMDIMLKTDDKVRALKCLSDGCRLLTDLHHSFSNDRKKLITPSLEKNFLHMIQDTERDDTLFGNTLAEKIKASKAIEKQGLQIRKTGAQKPATPTPQTSATRPTHQGNWTGPPRYTSFRGGAGRPQETCNSSSQALSLDDDEPYAVEELQSCQDPCQRAIATQGASSPEYEPYPGCREALRAAFTRRGTPPPALDLMLASLSDNTLKQYSVSLKLWWRFCFDNNSNVHDNSISLVLNFLAEQFSKGCSYGSLNSHRSALSLFLGDAIGSDDRIRRLLKGAYKLKPSRPKYSSTWDPQVVLNYISNWHPNLQLNIDKITKKLTILLALCTAHRVQTLSLIKLENITIAHNGIKIAISDIIKTSGPGREQPILFLPYFRDNPNICPASVLKDYIFVTKNLRTSNAGNLLLTTKQPHRAATAQSISRWIKQVLSDSGVDTSTFSAHSTRHAATSAASCAGLSVDTIRKTAGWTSTSTAFARFYNRPILDSDESDFARAVVLSST